MACQPFIPPDLISVISQYISEHFHLWYLWLIFFRGNMALGLLWCYRFSRSHSQIPLQWAKLPINNIQAFIVSSGILLLFPSHIVIQGQYPFNSSICGWKGLKKYCYKILSLWRLSHIKKYIYTKFFWPFILLFFRCCLLLLYFEIYL